MVGGGQGAFIGAVHRLAARMDDQYDFVAGALSSEPARARASGRELGLARDRIYTDYREMAEKEAAARRRHRGGVDRHAQQCACAGRHGIHRGRHPCDLRQAARAHLKEAKALQKLAAKNRGVIFALTHNYSGYPMIRQARAMVEAGELGDIRLCRANIRRTG